MSVVDQRQRELLRLLWREGRLSRWELHERTGVNPNAIGLDVAHLLAQGMVRECQSEPAGPGRPRVPVELDPSQRHVVGLSIGPGRVESGRINLRGNLLGKPIYRDAASPDRIVPLALELLHEMMSEQTLAIGFSVTGFVDPVNHAILTSSSLRGRGQVSLTPVYEAVNHRPIVLANNMHALAARWLLTHQAEASEDVLMARVLDGQMGAALLINGRPNHGCAIGANELGHVRFFVDTEVCYCGHPGCLERICSTQFLRLHGVATGSLFEHAMAYDGSNKPMSMVVDYLSAGIANAINFIRPHRMVLVSDLTRSAPFTDALLRLIRSRLLNEMVQRVRFDQWDQPSYQNAETAGWLALANLYHHGWNQTQDVTPA